MCCVCFSKVCAAAVYISGTSFDGFARIEFEWQSPVDYRIKEFAREVFITFSGIVDANPEILERKLPDYISSARLSSDLKTVEIKLLSDFEIKSFAKNGTVYIDIIGRGDYNLDRILKTMTDNGKKNLTGSLLLVPRTPKYNADDGNTVSSDTRAENKENSSRAEIKPSSKVKNEKKDSAPVKKAKREKKVAELIPVTLRGGKHEGYERVVFEWKEPVKYHINELNESIEIRFAKRGEVVNPDALKRFPDNLKRLSYKNKGGSFFAYVPLKEGATYKSSLLKNKLIVDVFYTPDEEDEKNREDEKNITAAPSIVLPVQDTVLPLDNAPIGNVSAQEEKKMPVAEPVPPDIDVKPEPKSETKDVVKSDLPKDADDPLPDKMPALANDKVEVKELASLPVIVVENPSVPPKVFQHDIGKKFAVLNMPFANHQKIAVFKRHGIWWVILSGKVEVNIVKFKEINKDVVFRDIDVIFDDNQNYTAVRLLMDDDIDIAARKDGSTWLLDLYRGKAARGGEIKPEYHTSLRSGTIVHMDLKNVSLPFTFVDPEIGDTLKVVCVSSSDDAFADTEYYTDFEIGKTVAGIVVAVRDPDVDVLVNDYGVDIRKKDSGLVISAVEDDLNKIKAIEDNPDGGKVNVLKLLDIGDLQLSAKDGYYDELFKIKREIMALDKGSRNKARLKLARFYLANFMIPEALGVLDTILLNDDSIRENAMFATMQGASNTLLNRYDTADEWFGVKSLDDNKEADLWKAYLSVVRDDSPENIKKNYPVFKNNITVLNGYPMQIRNKLAIQGLKIAVSLIDEDMAGDYMKMITSDDMKGSQKAAVLYYKGLMSALSGYFEQAFTLLNEASQSDSMYYRALAIREKLKLEFKLNRISHMDVLKKLEQLRYSWRGDRFEYDVMNDLVDIYLRNGQYGEALRILKDMAGIFKDKENNHAVKKRMEDIFTRLYLDGEADKLSPVKAIGIYNDFKEITPGGDKGNEMIRRLADRMVSVDLLDQAADLLKNQIDHRLKNGMERAIVGARLALINIMNNKPDAALRALENTDEKNIPSGLVEQRRLIKAKALSADGKHDDAVSLIKDDLSEEAKLLRVEILWDAKRWNEVSEVLRSMIKKPVKGQPLESGQPGIIIDWVTALRLAGREKVLLRVKENFAPYMKNTKFYDTFNLLTDVGDAGSAYSDFANQIKSAEGFKMFMNSYISKMKNEGLSGAIK